MAYRKFNADLLFDGRQLLDNTHVLVTTEEGKVEDITSIVQAGEDVQRFQGLLTPGFINTHCHLELSHMKSLIPEGTGLIDFLLTVIKKRGFPLHIIEEAMIKAEEELFVTGTVAVGDICNTPHSLSVKGTSKLSWVNFIEVLGFTENPEDRFRFASSLLQEFNHFAETADLSADHFTTALAPHAPYSVSEKLFRLINNACYEVTTIHNQESIAENQLYENKSGEMLRLYEGLKIDAGFFQPSQRSSLQTFLPFLDNPGNILLVHNTYTREEDIAFLNTYANGSTQQFFFVLCVNANQYIQSKLPPVELLRRNQLPVCIGTDSYASNHSINLLDEMRSIQQHFPDISLQEILGWATINGAKALKLDHFAGGFEKGKTPGVVHISDIHQGRIGKSSVSRRLI
jgi:aminodeoxyfutalosine deaminase